jgi:hypothetical protein
MRKHVALVFVLVAVAGCKKGNNAGDAGAAATGTGPHGFALPANVKLDTPKPKELGGKHVVAELCKLDTGASVMQSQDFDKAIGGIAAAPDGSLYVVDHEGKLRKYTVQTASPCQLALDTKFGTGGVLALETKPEDSKEYDTVSVDSKGNVYVSGNGAKAKLVTPAGQASTACDEFGRFRVDRTTGDTYLRDKRVKVAGGKCDPAEAKETWEGWPTKDAHSEVLDAANGLVFLNGWIKEHGKMVTKMGVQKPDGKKVEIVGDEKGDGEICSAADMQPCSVGYCVFDANCREMRAWGAAGGKLVGAVDVNELFGVGYSWPEGLFVTKGVTWATFSQQGEKDEKSDAAEAPHYGFVARITGLD